MTVVTGFGFAVSFPEFSFVTPTGEIYGAHNAFLQALTSGGALGLYLFVVASWRLLTMAALGRVPASRTLSTFHLGCGAMFLMHCMVESTFGVNTSASFAFIMMIQWCTVLLAVQMPSGVTQDKAQVSSIPRQVRTIHG